ncbi:hypothetical protein LJC42_00245 [Eubacteriales bacterium OttesenSCG-928-K08]|nr:hypothetical protein [Eubacteriales bacterium OttesenSCG-928-K08]
MIYKRSKKKISYKYLQRQSHALEIDMPELPREGEHFKLFSDGGFSSISIIAKIARDEGIRDLYVSTLRIGKKEMQVLLALNQSGLLDKATFFVGSIFANDKKSEYDYFTYATDVCEKLGWKFHVIKNHSKLILAETPGSHIVVETSSNLNENPKMEQFCIERDVGAFDFYKCCLLMAVKK